MGDAVGAAVGAAWFGLGQAELALGEGADTTRVGRRAFLSRDSWDRAIVAFSRALLADTSVAGAMEGIARDRLQRDQRPSALVVRDGFRRAVQQRTRNAESMLGLGRVEALLGDTTAALTVFAEAAEVPGGRARGLLEGVRLRLTRAEPEALRTYYEVAAVDDAALVAQLRQDIAWIATADELARYDAVSGAERAAFLEGFGLIGIAKICAPPDSVCRNTIGGWRRRCVIIGIPSISGSVSSCGMGPPTVGRRSGWLE